MTLEQLLLIYAILTFPQTTLKGMAMEDRGSQRCHGVLRRRGGNALPLYPRGCSAKGKNYVVAKSAKLVPSASDIVLDQAILSIKTNKRPIKCFLCLGNPALMLQEQVASYATPGSLSRDFMGKHE